jgi:GAF domain-containing protein
MSAPDTGAGVGPAADAGTGRDSPGQARLRQLAEEQAALRRVATLVAGGARPAEVFSAVADELGRLIGAEATFVSRFDQLSGERGEIEGYATVVGSYGRVSDQAPVGFRRKLQPGMAMTAALRTGGPGRISGDMLASGPFGEVVHGLGLRAAMAMPIVVEGRYWGVAVAATVRADFPPGTESRMTAFTELAATAIANAQAEEQLRELADTQAALRRLATLVARGEPPEAVFAAATREAQRHFGGGTARMIRYELDGTATLVAREGRPLPDEQVGKPWEGYPPAGLTATIRRTGQAARVDDFRDIPGGERFLREGIVAAVGTPVHVNGRLWGLIAIGSGEGPMPPDTEQRMTEFTEMVATAVANAQNRRLLEASRDELARLLEEQAALRRVATLVAGAAPPEAVFTAGAEEVGRLLEVDYTVLVRYDPHDAIAIVAAWTRTGAAAPTPVGSRLELGGRNVTSLVIRTGRPARIDDYTDVSGAIGNVATRDWSFRSSVGVPISVEGRLWGVMVVGSRVEPLPADTEARLAGFTELVGTAIANAQARLELRSYAEDQAALRRVATLVARAAPSEQVFAAVTEEVGRVLSVDINVLARYDPDGTETVLGIWTRSGAAPPTPVGSRFKLGGRNVSTLVFQKGRPARIDDYADSTGPVGDYSRDVGIRASVGVPISVEGRLWGLMLVTSTRENPQPADTEARLAGFTELVATAIANAEAQAALTASRARIVAAADTTRRRIERDLHDGAQQRLVSLALQLRSTAQASPPASAGELAAQMDLVADGLAGVLAELREIARGIHPAALAEGGLRRALKTLARRSAVPVLLNAGVDGRLPEPIELAAYYVVAEALTNTAKHASAAIIDVQVEISAGGLHVRIRDDGRGGADLTSGTGLLGLTDRVEALGGRLSLHSPPGAGTTVHMVLPLTAPGSCP